MFTSFNDRISWRMKNKDYFWNLIKEVTHFFLSKLIFYELAITEYLKFESQDTLHYIWNGLRSIGCDAKYCNGFTIHSNTLHRIELNCIQFQLFTIASQSSHRNCHVQIAIFFNGLEILLQCFLLKQFHCFAMLTIDHYVIRFCIT